MPLSRDIVYRVLEKCTQKNDLSAGRRVHSIMVKSGFDTLAVLGDHLIRLFGSFGSLLEANLVFCKVSEPSVFTWQAIISAHAMQGESSMALDLYSRMMEKDIGPDNVTVLCALKACGTLRSLEQGKHIHDHILQSGHDSDVKVGSSLVDMYGKCGSLEEAHMVFNNLPARNVMSWNAMVTGCAQHGNFPQGLGLLERMQHDSIKPNVVSWNTMISGYVQHGLGLHALELFQKMQEAGVKPDKVTFLCTIKACSIIGALEQGRLLHSEIVTSRFDLDIDVGNTLVDMYAKCGSLDEAHQMLDELQGRNVVSWCAMIGGYVQHGVYRLAMKCLKDMQQEGLKPAGETFASILAACSKLGQVEEGYQTFKSMREYDGVPPSVGYINRMINVVGRAGCLVEAAEMLRTMPVLPNITGWTSVLTSCKTFGNAELGRKCFDQVALLNPNVASGYVLMSNIYADNDRWDDVFKIQQLKEGAGAWKKPGRSWIEVNNKVEEFVTKDRSHHHNDAILAEIKRLRRQAEGEGQVPQFSLVLDPLSDEEKTDVLWGHSEKLAVAFGLLNTPKGTTIRVTKNLRLCTDCHNVMKIISKIERRQIIIRDGLRVHHFENGLCSCEDEYL